MILSSDEWMDIADLPEPSSKRPSERDPVRSSKEQKRTSRTASSNDLDIYETKLVTEAALNKYQSAFGDWHHARFGLMLSIAGRAKRMGIDITQDDLIHLFNQVDEMDGAHYQTSKYQREITNDAANALAQAG